MAVSTSNYFSYSNAGVPATGAEVDIYQVDSTPKYPLGFKIERGDGNVYRYAHIGAATAAGLLVAQDISESSVVDTDNVCAAAAIGAKQVTITLASTTEDQFAGAYLHTTDDTGEGYQYRIKGNTAADASNLVILYLADPIQVALDTTTDIAIVGSIYSNLEAATAGTDNVAVGVTCKVFSTAGWGWILTKGITPILQDGTIVIGGIVALSDGVAGAVHAMGGGGATVGDLISEPLIGSCVHAGDNTGYGSFKINLE